MDRNDNNDNTSPGGHQPPTGRRHILLAGRDRHFSSSASFLARNEIIVISINQCLFLKQSKPNLKLISHFGNLIFEIKLILEILGNYSVAGFEMVLNRKVNFTDTSNFTNFNQFRFKVLKKGSKRHSALHFNKRSSFASAMITIPTLVALLGLGR